MLFPPSSLLYINSPYTTASMSPLSPLSVLSISVLLSFLSSSPFPYFLYVISFPLVFSIYLYSPLYSFLFSSSLLPLCHLFPPCLFFISSLVGFGRACAPVRCTHPSFGAYRHAKRGAARPLPTPIAASLLLIRSPKID